MDNNVAPDVVEKIVAGIMENFPEADCGSSLRCILWGYKDWNFEFWDDETGKRYQLSKEKLIAAFPLLFTDKWDKHLTRPPSNGDWDTWEEWLCQSDATDFDAYVQLAIFGEVIYG
jgi:hypothetical protein